MDIKEYKTLNVIGSVPLKGMEICLEEMLAKGIILENYTVSELIDLCKDYSKMEISLHKPKNLELGYGKKLKVR